LQGVTTEVFDEAYTLGPSNAEFDKLMQTYHSPDDVTVFERLSEGLDNLASRGLTMNIASSLGGANLRVGGAGCDDRRRLTAAETERLRALVAAGGGSGILLVADLQDGTQARGRRLNEVATDLGLDDVDALLKIVSREPGTGAMYFVVAPEGIELGLRQPWVSIGSDAVAHPATAPWTDMATHPRTYGTFARVLGHYCRERGLFPFEEAVRRMTSLAADTFLLANRGRIAAGACADIVVLDPTTIADRAPHIPTPIS
jgi:N-acyl-D-aspartate/D-glutamate deacylase